MPKALRTLAGEPLLVHAVRALLAADSVGQVVVAAPPEEVLAVRSMVSPLGGDVLVIAGGPTRIASVGLALAAASDSWDVVLVHDAARPLVPPALVDAVAAAVVAGASAVIPALPMTDTVKQVDGMGRVVATVPRHDLVTVQTPQGFSRDVLLKAHAVASPDATDDAGLVEALGITVMTVTGHADAMKVTRPGDLLLAEAIIASRSAA